MYAEARGIQIKAIKMRQICRYCIAVLLLTASNGYAAFWQAENYAQRGVESYNGYAYRGDDGELRRFLNQVPGEMSGQSLNIDLPMPDGSLATYQIFESSIMQPELSAKFPQIRSFVVRGVDYPGSTGRVDISQKGFRGMVYTPYGRVFIDPLAGRTNQYVSRTTGTNDVQYNPFQCRANELVSNRESPNLEFSKSFSSVTSNRIPGRMLGYRLAVSATPEYVSAVSTSTPSVADAMAEINTAINRVNQIYERDLGIRLFLIANNDLLIDIDNEAGFTNEAPEFLISENQLWIDSRIKPSSYDIGHVLSTGSGGIAQLFSVCSSSKAQGASGLSNPVGDLFYIDFIAHEIGHQFGASHTFNGSTGSCGGLNRNAATAFEPGSGSTIMSYAGICGGENLQTNSDPTFHAGSISEINAFVSNTSTGGSCATSLALTPANSDPAGANAGLDKTIPAGTAFRLDGSATDVDGDVLSYQWDQMDAGTTATTASTFKIDQGDNPLFRSYVPQSSAERHFPSLENQLGLTSVEGEVLPATSRDLNFRMTVRDCKTGQASDDVRLSVDTTSGPFTITSHMTPSSFPAAASPTITWNVANTKNGLPNCQNVDIDLLSFSADKSTYAVVSLLTATDNDGSEQVSIDDNAAPVARFRVSCSDNVFYDISDADLNITGTGTFATTGNTTAMTSAGICGDITVVGAPTGVTASSGGGGGGSLHWLSLVLLTFTGVGGRYCKTSLLRDYT